MEYPNMQTGEIIYEIMHVYGQMANSVSTGDPWDRKSPAKGQHPIYFFPSAEVVDSYRVSLGSLHALSKC